MPGVVPLPVVAGDAPGREHPGVQLGARVGREDMEGRGLDAVPDRPRHGALEDIRVVVVHPEDEARVDHHPVLVQPCDGRRVVSPEVVPLALAAQIDRGQGLETDEEAAQPGVCGPLDEAGPQHTRDGGGPFGRPGPYPPSRRRARSRRPGRPTGDRRGSTDAAPADRRSRRARRRRPACRNPAHPRRTPACNRSRRSVGNHETRQGNSAPGSDCGR